MEQLIHVSFLPTSIPAQPGHPSLITFNTPATMLYHPSTQNLISNPLSSTQALSAAETIQHLWPAGPPCHRRYTYLLPGWPLFPVPHSCYFKPSLLDSSLLSTPDSAFWGTDGVKGGQSELSQSSYSSQVYPILYKRTTCSPSYS